MIPHYMVGGVSQYSGAVLDNVQHVASYGVTQRLVAKPIAVDTYWTQQAVDMMHIIDQCVVRGFDVIARCLFDIRADYLNKAARS